MGTKGKSIMKSLYLRIRLLIIVIVAFTSALHANKTIAVGSDEALPTETKKVITPRHADVSEAVVDFSTGKSLKEVTFSRISLDDISVLTVLKRIQESVQISLDRQKEKFSKQKSASFAIEAKNKEEESGPSSKKEGITDFEIKEANEIMERIQALSILQDIIAQTISLFEHIITGIFNTGSLAFNPDLEYRFISTYSCVDEEYSLQPRHRRELKKRIKSFNRYLVAYYRENRHSLSQDDVKNLNSIAHLNCRILTCFLKDELLGIDHWDRMLDFFFYQPLEWSNNHKKELLTAATSIAAVISAYLYYNSSKKNKSTT